MKKSKPKPPHTPKKPNVTKFLTEHQDLAKKLLAEVKSAHTQRSRRGHRYDHVKVLLNGALVKVSSFKYWEDVRRYCICGKRRP